MAIQYKITQAHWNYFLALERDFETVARFVEPCESNNDTFSLELARLLMTASQEVDVVLKLICLSLDDTASVGKIHEYRQVIDANLKEFYNETIAIPRFGMSSTPWIDWRRDAPPQWWTANNKIKHERSTHFDRATLRNTFNSIGGLLVAIVYYYKLQMRQQNPSVTLKEVVRELSPDSSLFRLDDDYYRSYYVRP